MSDETDRVQGDWVYQCKVTLKDITPPIWRRFLVEPKVTLEELHQILLEVMGWTGYHLHEFEIGDMSFTSPADDEDAADLPDDAFDDRNYRLERVLTAQKVNRFVYTYDFGDGWEHDVVIEARVPKVQKTRYPICVAGERACPPEDCGGPYGYRELLEILRNPKHPRHEEKAEWVGPEFDPEKFDLRETNGVLQAIRRKKIKRRKHGEKTRGRHPTL